MIDFQYSRADDVADAVRQIAADPAAKFIAGGANLIDLMKEDVERPSRLIDISRQPLNTVAETADGGLRIGALVPTSRPQREALRRFRGRRTQRHNKTITLRYLPILLLVDRVLYAFNTRRVGTSFRVELSRTAKSDKRWT